MVPKVFYKFINLAALFIFDQFSVSHHILNRKQIFQTLFSPVYGETLGLQLLLSEPR